MQDSDVQEVQHVREESSEDDIREIPQARCLPRCHAPTAASVADSASAPNPAAATWGVTPVDQAATTGWGAALADPSRGILPHPGHDIFGTCEGAARADFYTNTWAKGLGARHLRAFYYARIYASIRSHLPADVDFPLKDKPSDAWAHL